MRWSRRCRAIEANPEVTSVGLGGKQRQRQNVADVHRDKPAYNKVRVRTLKPLRGMAKQQVEQSRRPAIPDRTKAILVAS
jgi:hypothetical protein